MTSNISDLIISVGCYQVFPEEEDVKIVEHDKHYEIEVFIDMESYGGIHELANVFYKGIRLETTKLYYHQGNYLTLTGTVNKKHIKQNAVL